MTAPLPKRLKVTRGEDDYMPGNITEIELHNFMTFNHLKCKPASRLNLVIGPNGSGKSSLVCAVALGLGGDPQLLGRASSIGAFVKRGEDSGYVKITLRGHVKDENIIITRKIDTKNKSEWMLNGTAVPKKDIIEVIQKFNIQVNNLTQFLPQDRVCEFAKLSPVQLLEETEKAVGDPQLPVNHRLLIDKSNELKRLEITVKRNGETLNQLRALNAEQEKDVARVRQRQDLLKKVERMRKKLPWLRYDMKKAQYMEGKELEKDAKKKLDAAARILNDMREPIESQKMSKKTLDASCKRSRAHLDEIEKNHKELLEKSIQLGVQLKGKHNEMEELKKQEDSRHQRILKAKEDLAAAEMDLRNLPPYEPPKNEIEKLGSEILELDFSVKQKKLQKTEQENFLAQKKGLLRQCIDRLKDMENVNNKLLQALRNAGVDKIFDAYFWLQEHRHHLNKEVYGPVLLEANVSTRKHADYLEGHVPFYIWKSFITQDSADRDFLVKNMRSFDVPILNYVGGERRHKEPFQVSAEMHALGIYSRLDQVFDAPDAVKEVLITQSGLEHSYVGSKETDQRAIEVSRLKILDFWTPENHYRWSISRYGGHVSAVVEPVNNSRLLLSSLDSGAIEHLRSQKKDLEEAIFELEGSCKTLQSEQRHLEDEEAKLHRQREEIINIVQHEKKKRRDLENIINQRRRKLESTEKEGDVDMAIARLTDQAEKLNKQRFQCAVGIKNMLVELISRRRDIAVGHMASIEQDGKIKELESNLRQYDKSALQASLHHEQCKQAVGNLQHELMVAKKHAESIALITPELAKAFLGMPGTVEELEAAIEDTISEANSILFLNQNILEEYEMRRRNIESIAAKLEADESELRKCLKEIDSVKEKWLPMLRHIVGQINETFSWNFQEMAVAGEVMLDERDQDFDQYGVLIKVKFRQTGQLQVLSSHHQSGGERSVSTILYLVSLQDLANCPFRVVDEINQGMDPINERKMFQQLVRAASQPNTPQCFLLTPKLLPDLEYSETCSILNIMNGPWIEQPSKVWSNGDGWGFVTGTLKRRSCRS